MLTRAVRLFHTVRYLRPVQIYGRAAHRLRRVRPRTGPAPEERTPAGVWRLPEWRAPSMLAADRLRFLNEEHQLRSAADWNNPAWPRLWLYNLHYFDDLDARGADMRRDWHEALMGRWIAENPPLVGPGWEPYCLSLRIVNWCRFAWRGGALSRAAIESLAVQLHALSAQLETHLLGNHLIANAKALVFGGLFFKGDEADTCLRVGLLILGRELAEQVLSDGGHFERSPMYHGVIASDVLDLLEAARLFPDQFPTEFAAKFTEVAARMVPWADAISHPDGQIAFFNDAAIGIAPPPAVLREHAASLGVEATPAGKSGLLHLRASGYVRAEAGPAVLFADAAPIGPDYIPGHSHADTLSCELALYGRRVLVNGGTSTYENTLQRLQERQTRSHNAVVVDGADSSEVWSSFRVARRARAFGVRTATIGDWLEIEASHDGYRRLPGRVIHKRIWRLSSTELDVTDELTGCFQTAHVYWRLHPEVTLRAATESRATFDLEGIAFELQVVGGSIELELGYWAPEFGQRLDTQVVRISATAPQVISTWRWRGAQ